MQHFSSPLTLTEQEVALLSGTVLSGDALILVGNIIHMTNRQCAAQNPARLFTLSRSKYSAKLRRTVVTHCIETHSDEKVNEFSLSFSHAPAVSGSHVANWEIRAQTSHDTIMSCTRPTHTHTHTHTDKMNPSCL